MFEIITLPSAILAFEVSNLEKGAMWFTPIFLLFIPLSFISIFNCISRSSLLSLNPLPAPLNVQKINFNQKFWNIQLLKLDVILVNKFSLPVWLAKDVVHPKILVPAGHTLWHPLKPLQSLPNPSGATQAHSLPQFIKHPWMRSVIRSVNKR